MSEVRARVLSNVYVPPVEGFPIRTFGEYLPPVGPNGKEPPIWRAEMERRTLAQILPLIPKAEKPDILLISSPEYLPIPTDIASFSGLKILLITDWNVCLRFLPELCTLFDFCFTDWPGYRLLKQAGISNIHHQPLFGHNPEHYRFLGKSRDLDLSFCGNLNPGLHGERNRLLARIAKWGAGGQDRPPRSVHLRQTFNEAYVEVLNRSRLVFNYSIRGEANMRLYESMACGAVPLVEETNQEVSFMFQEDKHYFRYKQGGLEERLDSLLADAARLEIVSAAAREAVAGHTKSKQVQTLLETAIRETPGRSGGGLNSSNLPPATLLSGRKALIKLRVLGAGYSIAEAITEIETLAVDCPGLILETMPAVLLSVLSANAPGALASVEQTVERYASRSVLPEVLRAFIGMKLALWQGKWQVTIDEANHCISILREFASAPETLLPLYGYFHPPLDLGKGFTSDLNQAFREDLGKGKRQGYIDLLQAHCCADKSKALLSLGKLNESLTELEGVPLARFASLEPFGALVTGMFRIGILDAMRKVARLWFVQNPLDMGTWEKVFEAYKLLGVKSDIIAFLEEISLLAEAFMEKEQADVIKGMLERER